MKPCVSVIIKADKPKKETWKQAFSKLKMEKFFT